MANIPDDLHYSKDTSGFALTETSPLSAITDYAQDSLVTRLRRTAKVGDDFAANDLWIRGVG